MYCEAEVSELIIPCPVTDLKDVRGKNRKNYYKTTTFCRNPMETLGLLIAPNP